VTREEGALPKNMDGREVSEEGKRQPIATRKFWEQSADRKSCQTSKCVVVCQSLATPFLVMNA